MDSAQIYPVFYETPSGKLISAGQEITISGGGGGGSGDMSKATYDTNNDGKIDLAAGGTGAATAAAARTNLGLGTSATKDVASSGDASSTQVVKGDDSRLADSRAPTSHATSHKSGGGDAIKLDELAAPTDVTTLNVSTVAHGLTPKLPGNTTTYLRGDGTWATPAGGGGGATNLTYTASPTNGIVVSDTGTDATLPLVDSTNAGLMSPADKAKLDAQVDKTVLETQQALFISKTDPGVSLVKSDGIANGTYTVRLKLANGQTFTSVTAKANTGGTCTLVPRINTTALGNAAASCAVTATQTDYTSSSNNLAADGDWLNIVISGATGLTQLDFQFNGTRKVV